MPTYEYRCSKCGSTFEAFQSMTAPPLNRCQVCGAKGTVSRLVGAGAGLIFKGSGFYATDYKKSSAVGGSGGNGKGRKGIEEKSEKKEKSEATAPKADSTASSKD